VRKLVSYYVTDYTSMCWKGSTSATLPVGMRLPNGMYLRCYSVLEFIIPWYTSPYTSEQNWSPNIQAWLHQRTFCWITS